MDISQLDLTSPDPVLDAIRDDELESTTVAAYGKATGFDRLARSSKLRNLWVSGLSASSAEVIGSLEGLKRLVIHDLRLADLSSLARLPRLEELTVAGSSKLKSLAGLESLRGLCKLVLFDSCNYSDVDRLSSLIDLDTLCLEGGFSKQLILPTLQPLAQLAKLRRLRLASIKVVDGSLRPLHALHSLRDVFIAKAFAPAEFHSLGAALPLARGEFIDSFRNAG